MNPGIYATLALALLLQMPICSEAQTFSDDFESGAWFGDIVPTDGSRWTVITKQGGATPLFPPTLSLVHLGTSRSLQAVTPPMVPGGVLTKSSVMRDGLSYGANTHVWGSAKVWVATPQAEVYLLDLKDGNTPGSPGLRLVLVQGKWLNVNSKLIQRTTNQQSMAWPNNAWVTIVLHLYLSSDPAVGHVEAYQDDMLVISTATQTLVSETATVNQFEVGVTASAVTQAQTVYVDDARVATFSP